MFASAPVMPAYTPTPLHRPTVCLTARGRCALAVVRLDDQLRDLEPDDRDFILGMLRELLDGAEVAA